MQSLLSKIISLLMQKDYSFSELLEELKKDYKISKKELKFYIDEIIRISKNKTWKLYFIPAKCKNCGYEIKNYKPISKCPKCKNERFEEVRYFIK